jgi:hypothetical protein
LLDVFEVHGATLLRRGDCRDILESQPSVPDPAELAALVGDIERALSDGALRERKAVMQAVVAEIRVRDRGHTQPVFRVPIGPPYGLVHLALHSGTDGDRVHIGSSEGKGDP